MTPLLSSDEHGTSLLGKGVAWSQSKCSVDKHCAVLLRSSLVF